jgi:hypothetical protein
MRQRVADNLRQVLKDLDQFVDGLLVRLSLDVVANLVHTNPVDTGWSRSNWIPSIGTEVTQAHGSKTAVSGSAQQAGAAKLLSYTRDKGSIFIANNVPYIVRLNERPSSQGFVQAAIIRAITDLSK